ncbi:MAG TPA: DUF4838 domain-containing protein, partial [Terrimicrobiaceae bacterium]|nr:DUF4838 domain-containing protein [Terrimicrobiaceae bacterium]
VVLRRDGNVVAVAGSNDRSHYYAVVTLLNQWGCWWYMPTEFGEAVPQQERLALGSLDTAYAPPFELRNYWNSWNSSLEGAEMFKLRNFMNEDRLPDAHAIGQYVKKLIPEKGIPTGAFRPDGSPAETPKGTVFNVPITDPLTAEEVANAIDQRYANGERISLSMEDGIYRSNYPGDHESVANIQDKYFQCPAMADSFMTLYNQVAEILKKRHPESKAVLGFLAYSNMTIPPQRDVKGADRLFVSIGPIDIDPNHTMDDFRSPPRQEFREMVRRWSEIMDKRIAIYDYDQGMLTWRDLPNPSHHVIRKDIQEYLAAGALGVSTESRGAFATIFTNLFIRGQLLWNPAVDVDGLFAAFYPNFYGPAAEPMRAYWERIFQAWENTGITEHEYYVIPAIYTPELLESLRPDIEKALAAVAALRAKSPEELSRNEKLVLERVDFTKKSFVLMEQTVGMIAAAATDADYRKAAELGRKALQTRIELAKMNPTFTTRVLPGSGAEPEEPKKGISPALLPGEVQQYIELDALTNGTTGKLIKKLPIEWSFRRDPNDTGLPMGFAGKQADLTFWNANKGRFATAESRKDYPINEWETVRTDLYAQAQGILHPDWQSFTGFLWYKTEVTLSAAEAKGPVHLHFPGLFSEAWLYVNGHLVAHRVQDHMWWKNDYRFDWDINVTGKLQPGVNDITVRVHNTHHNGGMFRRPFLYRPAAD